MRCRGLLTIALAVSLTASCADAYPEDRLETFDPSAEYERIKRIAEPGAELYGIVATKVKSDGRMDLLAKYQPAIDYLFIRADVPMAAPAPLPQVEDAPIGSGLKAPKLDKPAVGFEKVVVNVRRPNRRSKQQPLKALHRRTSAHKGSADTLPKLLRTPACSFAELWEKAAGYGVPSNAVADITFDASEIRFTIKEVDVDLRFDHACAPIGYVKIAATNKSASRAHVYVTIDGEDRGRMDHQTSNGYDDVYRVGALGSHTLSVKQSRFGTRKKTIDLKPGTMPTIEFKF